MNSLVLILEYTNQNISSIKYSLVPKERHVRKESNGRTLGLYVEPEESHDCTVYTCKIAYFKGVMTAVLV